MLSDTFNPNSTEIQYGLQMACYLVHRYRPDSIRLCVKDLETAVAAVNRLAWLADGLLVEQEDLREQIKQTLGIKLGLVDSNVAPDVALMLFSRKEYPVPPTARHMVLLDKNAFSYKSLLYPGQIPDNVMALVGWFRQEYKPDHRIGLFGPSFLFHWSLSLMAGSRLSPMHFQLGQRAFDRLYTPTAMWWTGYMVLLSGDRRN